MDHFDFLITVKQEPPDSDDDMKSIDSKDSLASRLVTPTMDLESKKSPRPLFSRREHLEGKLLFFQLPDSLPALAPSGDDDGPRVGGQEGQGASDRPHAGEQANDVCFAKYDCFNLCPKDMLS